MHIPGQHTNPNPLLPCQVLQLMHEGLALTSVVAGRPVVVEVVEELDAAVEFVEEGAEEAGAAEGFEGDHCLRGEEGFEGCQAGVYYWLSPVNLVSFWGVGRNGHWGYCFRIWVRL